MPGPTGQNLTTPVMNVGTHRFWRRRAWRTGAGSCGNIFSNVMEITVWASGNLSAGWNGLSPLPGLTGLSEGTVFQWGRAQAWPATGAIVGNWPNNVIGNVWPSAQDPCPTGWRISSHQEWLRLANGATLEMVGTWIGLRAIPIGFENGNMYFPQQLSRGQDGTNNMSPHGWSPFMYWVSERFLQGWTGVAIGWHTNWPGVAGPGIVYWGTYSPVHNTGPRAAKAIRCVSSW